MPSKPTSDPEQRVAELLAEARATVRAPQALRARIEAQRPSRATRTRRRVAYGGAVAGALAATATVLALVLPGGAPGSPSVSQAAALANLGPAAPAPAADPAAPQKLQTGAEDLYFPNWSSSFGWRALGQRLDRIGGRTATTVYYGWRGHMIAYTIVAAPALKQPSASTSTLGGTELRTFSLNGRLVVTWRRANHTCVLSGAGVSASELQKLAAWKAPRLTD